VLSSLIGTHIEVIISSVTEILLKLFDGCPSKSDQGSNAKNATTERFYRLYLKQRFPHIPCTEEYSSHLYSYHSQKIPDQRHRILGQDPIRVRFVDINAAFILLKPGTCPLSSWMIDSAVAKNIISFMLLIYLIFYKLRPQWPHLLEQVRLGHDPS
jgi:hypothetical protein